MVNDHSLPKPVRVRFAPSPTGYMHIGNLRTALFNWLFAHNQGGKFLIRIEDTDLERSLPEYTVALKEALAWVQLDSDETIVIQSERKWRHLEVAENLLREGLAYKCFCTPEELRERLGSSAAEGEGYSFYDGKCLSADQHDTRPSAVRFKVPRQQEHITFHDLIRGPVTFSRDQFDDFIIVRSDGSPMYNFVVVVDDADMGITHVIRGEDHIPNTPKQIMLYAACGFGIPEFAHLSLILGPDGNRLSKRDAATGVLDYKRLGILPDALCNYLVRLGWAHGDQEIFSREELIKLFSLGDVGKKSAIFDIKKLEWMNGIYLRQKTAHELDRLIKRDLNPDFYQSPDDAVKVQDLIDLYQERSKTLAELAQSVTECMTGPSNEMIRESYTFPKKSLEYLSAVVRQLNELTVYDKPAVQAVIKNVCAQNFVAMPDLANPLRVALTGKVSSPGIYDLMVILGKDEVIRRVTMAQAFLTSEMVGNE